MERQKFLQTLGLGLAGVCAGGCLAACGGGSGGDDTSTPGNSTNPLPERTVTIELSGIATVGASAKSLGVLFIRIAEGDTAASFVATEAICPHQGGGLNYLSGNNIIECNLHAAQYQTNGTVIRNPQDSSGNTRKLKIYEVTIANNMISAKVV